MVADDFIGFLWAMELMGICIGFAVKMRDNRKRGWGVVGEKDIGGGDIDANALHATYFLKHLESSSNFTLSTPSTHPHCIVGGAALKGSPADTRAFARFWQVGECVCVCVCVSGSGSGADAGGGTTA